MEPYWKHTFKFENVEEEHEVKLYEYSAKAIALIGSPYFGKSFAKQFKELKGKFNNNLTINEEKVAGWIFRTDDETQDALIKLLGDIHSGTVKPVFTGIKVPNFDDKHRNNKIFNMIKSLIDVIPDGEEEIEYHSDDKMTLSMYFNRSEETVTMGDCIYMIEGAHKKLEVYQLSKIEEEE